MEWSFDFGISAVLALTYAHLNEPIPLLIGLMMAVSWLWGLRALLNHPQAIPSSTRVLISKEDSFLRCLH